MIDANLQGEAQSKTSGSGPSFPPVQFAGGRARLLRDPPHPAPANATLG
jgi:hypothetical protein